MAEPVRHLPITRSALLSRIRRYLAKDKLRLCHARGRMMASNFGDCYIQQILGKSVVRDRVDIEKYGREIGVLKSHEFMVKPKSNP